MNRILSIAISKGGVTMFSYGIGVHNFCSMNRDVPNICCSSCGHSLELGYACIIIKLFKKNLLPKDFNSLCCGCKNGVGLSEVVPR